MSRTVTLSRLKTDIAYQADVVIGSTGRYQASNVTRLINQSIQRFRGRVSQEGITHYLTAFHGVFRVGATAPYPFALIGISGVSDIASIYGFDVTMDGFTATLDHRPFTQRDENDNVPARPRYWSQVRDATLAVFPPADAPYNYTIWYLPVVDDLVNDTDTFDGVAGWEDYIVWDVVCRLIHRDAYPDAYQMASDERDRLWMDVLRSAGRVSAAGPTVVGRDTLGRTRPFRTQTRLWPFIQTDQGAEQWTPFNISGLRAWFRSDFGVVVSGGVVQSWTDVAQGFILTPPAGGPTYSSQGWAADIPTVTFDGSSQYLRNTDPQLAAMNDGLDITLLATLSNTGSGAYRALASFQSTNQSNWIQYYVSDPSGHMAADCNGSPSAGTHATAGRKRLIWNCDNVTLKSYVDGLTDINTPFAATSVSNVLWIGVDILGHYFKGDLVELVVVKGGLAAGDAAQYQNYSVNRWGA